MTMKRTTRRTLGVAGWVAASMVLALPAVAHVEPSPEEVPAGGFSSIAFRVEHGCDGSPTVGVAIEIPEGVSDVVPRAKAGWTITQTDTTVTWAGSLDAHQWDDFELSAQMPGTEGETIYFPVVQTCEQGEIAWIQIPAEGEEEPETPAPGVTLTAAGGDEHDHEAEGPVDEGGEDSDLVVWLAVALGTLGTILGGVAIAMSRRRS